MNWIYKFYFFLPNFRKFGVLGKVINRLLEIAMKRALDTYARPHLKKSQFQQGSGINTRKRDIEYIVSLTSFPERIDEIWVTVETLLRQSFKPDKIILWLSKVQFPNLVVPNSLLEQTGRGLEIEFVDDDIGSHKKYFYAFEKFPEANIITVDDDVYYPVDTLKHLVEASSRFKNCIIANRAHKITFSKGNLRPYRQWIHNVKGLQESSFLYVPTGVGGVLYPSNSYHKDIFDVQTFKKICFLADDLWIKVATLRNNSLVTITPYFNKDLISVGNTQRIKLVSSNSMGGGNDRQFKEVLRFFKIKINHYIE